MSRLRRSLARKRAIEAAAIQYHGWGRAGGWKVPPEEHWEISTPAQRKAAIELTEPIIEAYEQVMAKEDTA